jgi:hypothetical protein
LSDAEVEEKFAALADPLLSRAAQRKVRDAVWNLEKLESVIGLMMLLKTRTRQTKSVVNHASA